MKIQHIVWTAIYGGAETMLVDILNCQVQKHNVELVIINDLIEGSLLALLDNKINVILIKRPSRSRNLLPILKLNALILFGKADVIHFHQDDIIRYVPVRHLKNNLFLTVHSTEMDVISLPKYHYVFSISDVVKKKLKDMHGIDSYLVINGIDLDSIVKKQVYSEAPSLFRIVQISRLEHPHKGQDVLLYAVYKLLHNYHFSNFHLDITGTGKSETYLKALTNELGLDEYVTFTGVRSKEYIQKHIHEYDLLVQPSNWEGFGLAPIEAMAALVPVLVSNVEGLKKTARNGENAFMFTAGDSDDCAEMINKIIHLSVQEKRDKSNTAYKYAMDHFNVSRTAQDYLDHYQMLIESTTK